MMNRRMNDGKIRSLRRRELVRICGSRPSLRLVCETLINDVWHGPADTEPRIPRSWRFVWRALVGMKRRYPSTHELMSEIRKQKRWPSIVDSIARKLSDNREERMIGGSPTDGLR